MKDITFITGNPKKVEQLQRYLTFPIQHKAFDLPEIQSLDLETVAVLKAKAAYEMHGAPVLVEDTGLAFTALRGLPGPFVKWFLETVGNEGMCRMLDTYEDRTAIAQICFVLYDEDGPHVFAASRAGTISASPLGLQEFGWNPIFIPVGETKTWAEMSLEEQKITSMRRLAIEKVQTYLEMHYV